MFQYYLETFWIFLKISAFGLDESVFLMDPVNTKHVQLPVTIDKAVDTCVCLLRLIIFSPHEKDICKMF